MEGNYTRLLAQRLARATGVILLDVSTTTGLLRYLRRSWFERGRRIGGLEGGRDGVTWDMIRHIAFATRANRRRHAALFDAVALPTLRLSSARAINAVAAAEGLRR